MVYCGSGTETKIFFGLYIKIDPMVYCGSGTETKKIHHIFNFKI